jgi:hypothetical protein
MCSLESHRPGEASELTGKSHRIDSVQIGYENVSLGKVADAKADGERRTGGAVTQHNRFPPCRCEEAEEGFEKRAFTRSIGT